MRTLRSIVPNILAEEFLLEFILEESFKKEEFGTPYSYNRNIVSGPIGIVHGKSGKPLHVQATFRGHENGHFSAGWEVGVPNKRSGEVNMSHDRRAGSGKVGPAPAALHHVAKSVHSFIENFRPKSIQMSANTPKKQKIYDQFMHKLAKKHGGTFDKYENRIHFPQNHHLWKQDDPNYKHTTPWHTRMSREKVGGRVRRMMAAPQ